MTKRAKRAESWDFVAVCSELSCTWLDDGKGLPLRFCDTCPAMCCPVCGSHVALWRFPAGNLDAARELLEQRRGAYAAMVSEAEREVRH